MNGKEVKELDLQLKQEDHDGLGVPHLSLLVCVVKHTKYVSSTPSSFREQEFLSFHFCSYVPICDPRIGASIDPTDMYKLGRDPEVDVTYHI